MWVQGRVQGQVRPHAHCHARLKPMLHCVQGMVRAWVRRLDLNPGFSSDRKTLTPNPTSVQSTHTAMFQPQIPCSEQKLSSLSSFKRQVFLMQGNVGFMSVWRAFLCTAVLHCVLQVAAMVCICRVLVCVCMWRAWLHTCGWRRGLQMH